MLEKIKQRDYIENFINFVGTFLVTENATLDEINLVEANLDILKDRIQNIKGTVIKAPFSKTDGE